MSKRGLLIVVEGLDRCGKSTQCRRLAENLREYYKSESACVQYTFPDRTTKIGEVIDEYLKKRVSLSSQAVHLLFTANRWERNEEILNRLKMGVHVVVDRYTFSGAAYSTTKEDISLNWAMRSDNGLVAPDIVFYIAPKSEGAMEEVMRRENFGEEIYEDVEFQKSTGANFARVFRKTRTVEEGGGGERRGIMDRVYEFSPELGIEELAGRLLERTLEQIGAREGERVRVFDS